MASLGGPALQQPAGQAEAEPKTVFEPLPTWQDALSRYLTELGVTQEHGTDQSDARPH